MCMETFLPRGRNKCDTNYCRIDETRMLAHILFLPVCVTESELSWTKRLAQSAYGFYTAKAPLLYMRKHIYLQVRKARQKQNHSSSSDWLSEYRFLWDTQGEKKVWTSKLGWKRQTDSEKKKKTGEGWGAAELSAWDEKLSIIKKNPDSPASVGWDYTVSNDRQPW